MNSETKAIADCRLAIADWNSKIGNRKLKIGNVLAPAFTLIELMVVVGIIGLLITIVVPSFAAVRKRANITATTATISAISLGIEGYRTDSKLGEQYPPSVHVNAISPHDNVAHEVDGANLIVWALAGADLLGTPGFKNWDNDGTAATNDPYGGWLSDTGKTNTAARVDLYAVNPDGTTGRTRYGPYVDLSKVKLTKPSAPATASFVIPGRTATLYSLAFLDNFDIPILYYKANVGVPRIVDSGDFMGGTFPDVYKVSGGQYVPTGIYNLLDNANITGHKDTTGIDFGGGANHFPASLDKLCAISSAQYISGTKLEKGSFAYTVWNPNVTAALKPQRDDSFILLSAGPDGLFGTADDIGNFPIND